MLERGLMHALDALCQGRIMRLSYRRLGGPQCWSGQLRKISPFRYLTRRPFSTYWITVLTTLYQPAVVVVVVIVFRNVEQFLSPLTFQYNFTGNWVFPGLKLCNLEMIFICYGVVFCAQDTHWEYINWQSWPMIISKVTSGSHDSKSGIV